MNHIKQHPALFLGFLIALAMASLLVGIPSPAEAGGLALVGLGVTYAEPLALSDVLLTEVPGISKDDRTFTDSDFVLGEVVAELGGKIVALAPAALDASATAVGIAAGAVAAASADARGFVIARTAAVDAARLVWPTGATSGQKTTALAQLKALGIVARTVQ